MEAFENTLIRFSTVKESTHKKNTKAKIHRTGRKPATVHYRYRCKKSCIFTKKSTYTNFFTSDRRWCTFDWASSYWELFYSWHRQSFLLQLVQYIRLIRWIDQQNSMINLPTTTIPSRCYSTTKPTTIPSRSYQILKPMTINALL